MPGPPPDPQSQRSKRRARGTVTQLPQRSPSTPSADPAWLPTTIADWHAFWASPPSRLVTVPQIRPLRRLFGYYDQRDRFAAEGMTETLVEGSTGQTVLNPLLKALPALDSSILALEDRFGGSPLAAMKLGQAFGDAHRSLSDVNARIAAAHPSVDDEDDPRRLVSG